MQPWENQRGTDGHHLRRWLDARRRGIFLDCALLLDGSSPISGFPSHGTQGWPWPR